MIFPCMELFFVIFQVFQVFQCSWEPCYKKTLYSFYLTNNVDPDEMQSREGSIMLHFHLGFHGSGLQKFSFGVSGIQRVNLCTKWIFFGSYKVDNALSQEDPCWELARYLIFQPKTTTKDIIVCM